MGMFARQPLDDDVLDELASIADTIAQFLGREQAAADERHRLAQELHDTVSQALYGITLAAESGKRGKDATEARILEDILDLTSRAQAQLRSLIRDFRPDSFERDGLRPALTELARAFTARHRIPVDLHVDVEPGIDATAKLAVYRIAQEALSNVGRHAGASRVV